MHIGKLEINVDIKYLWRYITVTTGRLKRRMKMHMVKSDGTIKCTGKKSKNYWPYTQPWKKAHR
jgi:hypothetical protein